MAKVLAAVRLTDKTNFTCLDSTTQHVVASVFVEVGYVTLVYTCVPDGLW